MPAELNPGRSIGPYLLLFRLGRGGMGEVWAAERRGPGGFAAKVALKIAPAPNLTSNTALLFLDEARVAARLEHPAIVRTLDLGVEGELGFIALELVRGPSLAAVFAELAGQGRRLTPVEVAHVGLRVASALEHAYHGAPGEERPLRLIHRDVSPQNILLDATGAVRLADFGVAKSALQEHRTEAGVFRGKPAYMSPEQARAQELDDRSDVFALAVVLHECAAGRRLFARKDAASTLAAALTEEVAPLAELVPGFPPALSAAVAQALEKDRRERPRVRELRAELEALGPELAGWAQAAHRLGQRAAGAAQQVEAGLAQAARELSPAGEGTWAPAARAGSRSAPPRERVEAGPDAGGPAAAGPTTTAAGPLAEPLSLVPLAPVRRRWPPLATGTVAALLALGIAGVLLLAGEAPLPLQDQPVPEVRERTAAPAASPRAEPGLPPPEEEVPAALPARPSREREPRRLELRSRDAAAPSPHDPAEREARALARLVALEGRDPAAAARLKALFVEAKAGGDEVRLARVVAEIEASAP